MYILYAVPSVVILIFLVFSMKKKCPEFKREGCLYPFCKLVIKLSELRFGEKIFIGWIKKKEKQLRQLYPLKNTYLLAKDKCVKIIAKAFLIIIVGSMVATLSSFFSKKDKEISSLTRKDAGGGSSYFEIYAKIDGITRKLPVTVTEREYTVTEINNLFDYGCRNIERLILGENNSADCVTTNLSLIENIPNSAVSIKWECDNYEIVSPEGNVDTSKATGIGADVLLTAVFSYKTYEKRQNIKIRVCRPKENDIDGKFSTLSGTIEKLNTDLAKEKDIKLPEEILGSRVIYDRGGTHVGIVIFLLGFIFAVLLPIKEESETKELIKKRDEQLVLDYPELVYKMSLFLRAGLSIKKAWEKIAVDYIELRRMGRTRPSYCYDEVIYSYRQQQAGSTDTRSFEQFGNNCRLQQYKKFSMLINSGIRRGGKELSEMLLLEAEEAFSKRREAIKVIAERASMRLLLPMIIELGIVMGVLIFPAFMSMKF